MFKSILMCKTAHEAWTKLDDVYGGSYLDEANIFPMETIGEVSTTSCHEEHPIASTSDYLDTSTSSSLPTFSLSQEETKKNVAHLINEDLSCPEKSSPMHMCLMARGNHEVSSSLSDDDDDCDENDDAMTQNLY